MACYRRILMIDDDADDRLLFSLALKKVAPEITAHYATDGEAALSILAEAMPDLIITDLNMPKMDGWQFIEALRAKGSQTPVIIFSTTPEVKESIPKMGIIGIYKKAFSMKELHEKVLSMISTKIPLVVSSL
ncbi:MAG: response regulator [Chitinophagaceae bacterium]